MDQKTSLRFQLISAWCGPAFLVTFVLFWGVIGHNLPNPSPALSATDLAARYSENLGEIRLGFIVSLIIVCLYMPWCSYISARMAKIEGGYPVLANLQLIGGALTVMVVSFSACFWAIAAFRPDRDPALIQLLTDSGWLIIDLQYACTTLQMVALALAVLSDRKNKADASHAELGVLPDHLLRGQLLPGEPHRRSEDRPVRLEWRHELLLPVLLLAVLGNNCEHLFDQGCSSAHARVREQPLGGWRPSGGGSRFLTCTIGQVPLCWPPLPSKRFDGVATKVRTPRARTGADGHSCLAPCRRHCSAVVGQRPVTSSPRESVDE